MRDILSTILEYREARGWTEYELARRSGLTQSTISTWYRTNCKPSMKSLQKICDVFGITMSQLIEEDEKTTLTQEQQELLKLWAKFSEDQRKCFLELFRTL